MNTIYKIFLIMVVSVFISSCSSSEEVIQTAIAQTQKAEIKPIQSTVFLTSTPTIITSTPTIIITSTPIQTFTPIYTPSITLTNTITNTPTKTQIPTITPTNTVTPSLTPTADIFLHLSLAEFLQKYNSLSDLQKKEFVPSLPGKKVQWTGVVLEVYDDGQILISIPGTLASSVSLKGVPIEVSKTVNKKSSISFTATIQSVVDFLGLHIYLVDGKIIK